MLNSAMFDMIIFRTVHIIAWIVVEFIITDHSAEGAKLRIYNQHVERGYPGIEHHIACVAISGVIYGSITFVNPAGEDVLDCPKFSYTCTPLGGVEYFQSNLVDNGYVLAIRRFHPKRDAGTWKCRDRKDSDASHVVSVEVKSSPLYRVVENNLPEQRSYQKYYDMRIVSTCTYKQPRCEWHISGLITALPGIVTDVLEDACGDNFKYTCLLRFSQPPKQFMDKYIMFSLTVYHPSIYSGFVPNATRLLDFSRVRLTLKTTELVPAEHSSVNLTCSVFQYGKLTGKVKFLRKEQSKNRALFAYIDQRTKGCGKKFVPAGYDIACAKGTESANNYRREYIFLFYKIRKADFVLWTCCTAEKYSKSIRLLPYMVRLEISTTNQFPVKNAMVHIMCIILQQGTLTGAVQFLRRQKRATNSQKIGELMQTRDHCTPNQKLPVDYSIACGLGTYNATTATKMYKLKIKKVRNEDYAYWYCHHQTATMSSRELRLAAFSVEMHLKTSTPFPPPGSSVDLECTISKSGVLFGLIQFHRMTSSGQYVNVAHLRQTSRGCLNKVAPDGYQLVCGAGTKDVTSRRQVYTLKIASVAEDDYTSWYCYEQSEDYISQNISLAPFSIKLDINTTDTNPPINTTTFLMCTVMQYKGGLNGKVVFYSRETDKNSRQMGYVIQQDDKCSAVLTSHRYGLECGDGTKNKLAKKKVYNFVIKRVAFRDYTYWYCHHVEAKIGSQEILLGPSSAHSEKFAGSLGGGIVALIIVSSLMAAAVPTAVSGIYYKRRKKRLLAAETGYDYGIYTEAEPQSPAPEYSNDQDDIVYEYNEYPEAEPTTQFTESDFWHSFFKEL